MSPLVLRPGAPTRLWLARTTEAPLDLPAIAEVLTTALQRSGLCGAVTVAPAEPGGDPAGPGPLQAP